MKNDFQIHLGEPSVIARRNKPSIKKQIEWGEYQFPSIERTAEGMLHAVYHINADSALAYGKPTGHAISLDGGKSWNPVEKDIGYTGGIALANGDRIRTKQLEALDPATVKLPDEPDGETVFWGVTPKFYYQSRFSSEFNAWAIDRFSKGEWKTELKPVEISGSIVRYVNEGVMPHNMLDRICVAPDGGIWYVAYEFYLNSYNGRTVFQPVFLRSDENAQTLRFMSTIPYEPIAQYDDKYAVRDGFTEPSLLFLPNGDAITLMRTEDQNGNGPSYICHSYDGGSNWTKPAYFDDLGVYSQLLHLKCGITLASYGRPGVYVRGTSDPKCEQWQPRVTILDQSSPSCAYTGLIADGDDSALLVYSDFMYPDENGTPKKTIMCRRLEIV